MIESEVVTGKSQAEALPVGRGFGFCFFFSQRPNGQGYIVIYHMAQKQTKKLKLAQKKSLSYYFVSMAELNDRCFCYFTMLVK